MEGGGTSPLNVFMITANSGVTGYCILFSITIIAVIRTELGRTATSNEGAREKVLHVILVYRRYLTVIYRCYI